MRNKVLCCSGLVLALLLQCLTLPARALVCVVGAGTGASCTESALDACLPGGAGFDGAVTFNCGGSATITVTSTKTISANTTIDGNSFITLDGGHQVRVFYVSTGAAFTVRNLAIANGQVPSSCIAHDCRGGAIHSYGSLTVIDSTFENNHSGPDSGGGAINSEGTLTVVDSTFLNNEGSNWGGAIGGYGPVTISGSTFSGNACHDGGGGAVGTDHGPTVITNSTFSGNNGTPYGTVDLDGPATITNCTFTGDTTTSVMSGDGMTTVANTIITGGCLLYLGRPLIDGGHNIDSGTSCGFSSASGSLDNTNPVLDPTGLQNNGGPTQTIALQGGSPAINAGNEGVCAASPVNNLDQRGFVRPGTGATNCSIGAFEFNSPGPPTIPALTNWGIIGFSSLAFAFVLWAAGRSRWRSPWDADC